MLTMKKYKRNALYTSRKGEFVNS